MSKAIQSFTPPSVCPHCGGKLAILRNIPGFYRSLICWDAEQNGCSAVWHGRYAESPLIDLWEAKLKTLDYVHEEFEIYQPHRGGVA